LVTFTVVQSLLFVYSGIICMMWNLLSCSNTTC